jgi:hypothetical protein
MFKNVASQKIAVYAHDKAADTAKTGDAGNITAQISIDGAATAATDDVNPTELDAADAPGVYIFDMTQAETNGDLIIVAPVSSTNNVTLETVIIYTVTVIGAAGASLSAIPWNASWDAEVQSEVQDAIEVNNLDHLMKTAVANNADMTTEVTDGTVLSNIMTKGSDTSDFVVGDDSLEAIRDAIVDANPQNHSATANNETTGTLDAGTFADTATDNAVYWQTSPVTPAVGGFGLNVDLTFGIGTGRVPSAVIVNGRFTAGALRTVQVWAYDYNAAAYVQLSNSVTDFGNSGSDSTQQYAMTTNMVQTSDGEVKTRFTSTSTTVGDDWYCDYVVVSSVAQEAAGLTAEAIAEANWEHTSSGHDEGTMGYTVGHLILVNGDIVSATDATQFIIDDGVGNNDAYNGMIIRVEDTTTGYYEERRIVDYIGATKEVFVDRAFSFTPDSDDEWYIVGHSYADVNVTHSAGTAQTANDNGADINTLITNIGTPANIDGGGATLSDNIKKLADDNDGATFDATTDSLTSIRDNELTTIAGDVVNIDGIVPAAAGDAMTLSNGAITAGVIATDAVDADAIAANAVTEIQSGLATASALTTHDNKLAPVALDGGGATIGGMLTKMADDNSGADFDAGTDSLQELRDRGDTAWTTGATAPTAVQIRQEMDSNSTQLSAIVGDTNELQADLANGGRLDLILDAILTDTALLDKWLKNRIVFSGTSMVLYDDDNSTPLLTWTLSQGSTTVSGPYNRAKAT